LLYPLLPLLQTETCIFSRGFSLLGTGSNWQRLNLDSRKVTGAQWYY
jgi:hypothetical protein